MGNPNVSLINIGQVCHPCILFRFGEGRSFEEAAAILQTDLFEKQAKNLEDLGEPTIHL